MRLWKKFKETDLIFKAVLIGIAILAAGVLLSMPLLTVDAGETANRGISQPGLAFMARQEATGGILLLGSVLVLIIVGGTMRVLSQDRLHRPHLLKKSSKEEQAPTDSESSE